MTISDKGHAPDNGFGFIMEMTAEEKKELLKLWKEREIKKSS